MIKSECIPVCLYSGAVRECGTMWPDAVVYRSSYIQFARRKQTRASYLQKVFLHKCLCYIDWKLVWRSCFRGGNVMFPIFHLGPLPTMLRIDTAYNLYDCIFYLQIILFRHFYFIFKYTVNRTSCFFKIWGFHGGDYEECRILGSVAV
jgi:hypothetical protein